MKFLSFILSLFYFTSVNNQSPSNSIEISKVHIVNKLRKSYSLGSANQLQQAFGKLKAVKEKDEVQDGFGYTYNYKGLSVDFHEHDWDSAIITGPEYAVELNGKYYKVGDSIGKLAAAFPISYKHSVKTPGNGLAMLIDLADKKQLLDALISISYNDKNCITEIWIGNNDS
jgi:hypothetical protein